MDRILGANTIDLGGGRRGFRGKDTVAGIPGTELTAVWHNAVQEEIVGAAEKAGFVPDGADLHQLARTFRSQHLNAAAAAAVGGTANAITLAFDPPFANLAELEWAPLRFLVEAIPTGPVTIAVDAIAAAPLRDSSGSQLGENSLAVGQIIEIIRIGASFVLLAGQRLPAIGGSTTAAPLLKSIDAVISVNNSVPTTTATILNFQTTTRNNLGSSTWNGQRLTIGAGEAGLWYVQAAWSFFTPADDRFAATQIRKNGTTVIGEGDYPYNKSGGGTIVQGETIIPLAAGDYIEAMAYHQAGSTQPAYADARSRFLAALLSAY